MVAKVSGPSTASVRTNSSSKVASARTSVKSKTALPRAVTVSISAAAKAAATTASTVATAVKAYNDARAAGTTPSSVTIKDSISNVNASWSTLTEMAAAGLVTSLSFTDKSPNLSVDRDSFSGTLDNPSATDPSVLLLQKISGKATVTLTNSRLTDIGLRGPTSNVTVSFAINEDAATISGALTTLQNMAKAKQLNSLSVSDSATPINVSLKQLSSNADVFKSITGNYALSVNTVSVADLAKTAANSKVTSISLTDNAANFIRGQKTIKSTGIYEKISNVTLNDLKTVTLNINDASYLKSLPDFDMSSAGYVLADTTRNIIARLRYDPDSLLQGANSISLTDKNPAILTLDDARLLKATPAIAALAKYSIADADNLISAQNQIEGETILSASSAVTMVRTSSISSAKQLFKQSKITNSAQYAIKDSVTNILIQNRNAGESLLAKAFSVTGTISASDLSKASSATLDALQALVRSNKLTAIQLSDAGNPVIVLSQAQLINYADILGRITSPVSFSTIEPPPPTDPAVPDLIIDGQTDDDAGRLSWDKSDPSQAWSFFTNIRADQNSTANVVISGSDWGIDTLRTGGKIQATISDLGNAGANRSINVLSLNGSQISSDLAATVTLSQTRVGTIIGNSGKNYSITLGGGTGWTRSISTSQGNDTINIDTGQDGGVEMIAAGAGDNQITLSTGWVGTIQSYRGNDIVTIGSGEVDVINVGAGDNIVATAGGWVGTIQSYRGNDTVSIGPGGADTVNVGSGNNSVTTSSGWVGAIQAYRGNDTITIGSGGAGSIIVGSGDNMVTTGSGNVSTIEAGDGNDIFSIGSGGVGFAHAGGGENTFIFQDAGPNGGGLFDGGWDQEKNNLLDLSALTSPVTVSLSNADWQNLINPTNDASNRNHWVKLSNFRKLIATNGDDLITGAYDRSTLVGGRGNDTLYGQSGSETSAQFSGALSDYSISKDANGIITVTDNRDGSPDGTDQLNNITQLIFSDGILATSDIN